MGKIVHQSERIIQAHMDQMVHFTKPTLGTWNNDKRTRGKPPEQPGGGWHHLAVPTAMVGRVGPDATDLQPMQEASFLLP